MSRFENFPKDVIFYLALKLDLSDILSLCRTCKKFNISICENRYFWIARLRSDYDINYMTIKPIDPKIYYRFVKKYINLYTNRQLTKAAEGGHKDIVQLMIDKGANPDRGLFGAAEGGHKDIVQMMIDKGADDWNEGLAAAAFGGHIDIVQMMINKGATDWDLGRLAASLKGHQDITELLGKGY